MSTTPHPLINAYMTAHDLFVASLDDLTSSGGERLIPYIQNARQDLTFLADSFSDLPSATDSTSTYQVVMVLSRSLQILAQHISDISNRYFVMHSGCAPNRASAKKLLDAISIADHIQWSVCSVARFLFQQKQMYEQISSGYNEIIDMQRKSGSLLEYSIAMAKPLFLDSNNSTSECIAITGLSHSPLSYGPSRPIKNYLPSVTLIWKITSLEID